MSSDHLVSPAFNLSLHSSESSTRSSSPLLRSSITALTPRRAITPRQAIDGLELAVTQANDVQHILREYASKIDEQTARVSNDIGQHIDGIIATLTQRKQTLFQQVSDLFSS